MLKSFPPPQTWTRKNHHPQPPQLLTRGCKAPSGEVPLNKTFHLPGENLYSRRLHNGISALLGRVGDGGLELTAPNNM